MYSKEYQSCWYNIIFVEVVGLEPTRLTAPDPKSGSATSYDTLRSVEDKRKPQVSR